MLIGYMRVSKADSSQTLDLQRILAAARRRRRTEASLLRPCVRQSRTIGRVWRRGSRRGGRVTRWRAWKLDHLARLMKQLIETIEELRLKGIGFRSLTEALDTTSAQGRLVFHSARWAEFERSLIRERT